MAGSGDAGAPTLLPVEDGVAIKRMPFFRPKRNHIDFKTVVSVVIAGMLLSLIVGLLFLSFPRTLNSSCILQWNVSAPCCAVRTLILRQILCRKCLDSAEGCRFSLQGQSKDMVYMAYKIGDQKLNMAVKFMNGTREFCLLRGKSIARSWYLLFNQDHHYCTLHTLMDNTGIPFEESVNTNVCNPAVC